MPIDTLNFSSRPSNDFNSNEIPTAGDLLNRSEDDLLRNLGQRCLPEVKTTLMRLNLALRKPDNQNRLGNR